MNKYLSIFRNVFAMGIAIPCGIAFSQVTIPNVPLVTQITAKPMVMLTVGKDHRMFYEAYNDASDIDGDGAIDIRFKPKITYLGNFDSTICYEHNGKSDKDGLFTPSAAAGELNTCSSGKWSGNWLNYVTTSRIDALRKVLYGGYREIDSTSETILRRAYIPQDAHSWGKEYTSEAVDGYKISDYTPLSQPSTGKRHFFGSLTPNAGKDCTTLSDCSEKLQPWLSVVTNSSKRIWEWASTERPVLADGTHGGTRTNYTVRVKVCTSSFNNGCKQYGTVYKPIGLLHDYGENNAMLFGLLTGSYDKNMSGGVLRKVVSSFADEVNPSTGQFTSSAKIIKTFDALRIRDFNNGRTDNAYKGGWQTTSAMTEGTFPDWGNPIGEMMYEGLRYFAGKGTPTTDFYATTATKDSEVGLSRASWDDPYSSSSSAKAPRCAKSSFLTISDINPSYDSNQLPGSEFASFTGDVTGLNVLTEATTITATEDGTATGKVTGKRFIGRSGSTDDSAPTAKDVTSLGKVRGLAPEEPTKQGSYYSGSVAYFSKRSDIRSDLTGTQSIDTFSVVLASPLPQLAVKLPNGKVITVVPFAKSTGGSSIDAAKGKFQPTNQIVDFYIEQIVNSGTGDKDTSVNGGRFYSKFRINFEDVEQGADHDMDAIVEYVVKANADSTLTVTVTPTYQAGGIQHAMGYVISGTTNDGVYLVVQDENLDRPYFLNVPPGRSPGYCDNSTNLATAACKKLPYVGGTAPLDKSEITFSPSSTASATFLRDPLWYAAKWGGFKDKNGNNKPDLTSEWDSDGDGVPDTYFLVQNPVKLKEALQKAFDQISVINSSAANVIANSSSISTDTRVYQARFDSNYWSGDLVAYPVTSNGVSGSTEWEASSKMPSAANRKIFIRNSDGTTREFNGTSFTSMPSADQGSIVDLNRLNYLRGDRTLEISNGVGTLRNRAHALGDLVHSSPYFIKDSNTVFVGGNDGMLHAFNGSTGVETFAYIPTQSISKLGALASTSYTHDFYVDGDIVVGPKSTETGNKNWLFGALGRGGKGLFALDVTDPTTFSTSNSLWEYTPAASSTAASDVDLGYILGRPIFAKLNNGSVAIIFGNGVNSTNGKAVLYILVLNSSGQIASTVKLDTGAGSDNGLFGPAVFDTNNDGNVDVVYAGDLKGNVWKFNLSAASTASWGVSHSGKPLFVATSAAGIRQPITAPLTVVVNNKSGDEKFGKRFVFFGTGAYFRSTDPADTATQSWYGIIDDESAFEDYLPSAGKTYQRDFLKTRTVSSATTYGGKPSRYFSAVTAGDMASAKGWVIDWSVEAGERIITESIQYKLKQYALIASSMVPSATDPCVPGGTGYVNAVDPWSGSEIPGDSIFDVNADNSFSDDKVAGRSIGSVNLGVGLPSRPTLIGSRLVVGGTDSVNRVKDVKVNPGAAAKKGRISWREIIKD
ncbi:PilC/PilY family type IV pilus protein [Curvibacter sp. APW13]|uniref:pilus assembly protein n=1 Tax=Curvibacter sp. APW13 TaxID=3077236 RepID=UPI0028E06E8B|nr:PilC/PilY family type IV pilus protein [Curvibacter sp. APW13]MDT8991410.1 PilC/PilY family type IV pilus protein [Curvibacter sp. APW13]